MGMLIIVLIYFNVRIFVLWPLLFGCLLCFNSLHGVLFFLGSPKLNLHLQFSLLQYLRGQINGIVKGWLLSLCKVSQYFEYVLQFLIDGIVLFLDGLLPMQGRYLSDGYFLTVIK